MASNVGKIPKDLEDQILALTRERGGAVTAAVPALTRINNSMKSLAPESEKVARNFDEINKRLKTQNNVLAGVIGTATGALTAHEARGLAGAASPNGLASVDKAASILSGTIGTLLLPGFVALGGAALTAADYVQEWIDKNLDDVIDWWADAIENATASVQDFKDWLDRFQQGEPRAVGQGVGGAAGGLAGAWAGGKVGALAGAAIPLPGTTAIGALLGAGLGVWAGSKVGGAIGEEVGGVDRHQPEHRDSMFPFLQTIEARTKDIGKAEAMKEWAGNMRAIAQDMRMSTGQASINDPSAKWKELALQLARSELDQRMMDMQERSIKATEKLVDQLEKRANGILQGGEGAVINGRVRRAR